MPHAVSGEIPKRKEDILIIWWAPNLENEDVFVLPMVTVEEAVKSLGILSSYDEFLGKKEVTPADRKSEGSVAFLSPDDEILPWSYVSILDGGKKYTDPMEYLVDKYNKTSIVS